MKKKKPNLLKHLDDYLNSHDLRPASKRVYAGAIKRFFTWCGRKKKNGWLKLVLKWRDSLDGKSARTRAMYVSSLSGFFDWCVAQGHTKENPFERIHIRIPNVQSPRQALTLEEVKELLAFSRQTGMDYRDYAILILMLHTGLRVGSVPEINIEDIKQLEGGIVLYYTGKYMRGKDKFVVLAPIVVDAIKDYLVQSDRELFGGQDTVFFKKGGLPFAAAGIAAMIRRRLGRAGIERNGITPHSLRHTAASVAVAGGATTMKIKEMLGHSSVATTEKYLHSLGRMKDAAELEIDYGLKKQRKGKRR